MPLIKMSSKLAKVTAKPVANHTHIFHFGMLGSSRELRRKANGNREKRR